MFLRTQKTTIGTYTKSPQHINISENLTIILDFVHSVQLFSNMFRKLDVSVIKCKRKNISTHLGPSERATSDHWTQKKIRQEYTFLLHI
jgi:hypothetical protein